MPPVRTSSFSSAVHPTQAPSPGRDPYASTPRGPYSESNGGGSSSSSGNGASKQEPIKQQKACIHCRKSKVKCVHDGGPPCRRCIDSNQECKFRLRADDENWRESTDDNITRLSDAVQELLDRMPPRGAFQAPAAPPVQYGQPPQPPPPQGHPYRQQQHSGVSNGQYHSQSHPAYSAPGPSDMGPPSLPSPRQLGGPQYSPAHPNHSSGIKMGSFSGELNGSAFMDQGSPHNGVNLPPPRMSFSSTNGDAGYSQSYPSYPHKRSASWRSDSMGGNGAYGGPSSPGYSGNAQPGPSSRPANGGPIYPTGPTPFVTADAGQQAIPQSLQVALAHTAPTYLNSSLPLRWTSGILPRESYASAVANIGQSDPRTKLVKERLVPIERLRPLFVFFAEKMQPHSFGFPTFPPVESMTPLIVAAIATAASLQDPQSRQYHCALKMDVLAELPLEDKTEEQELNPEIGIGVEEITGACIASAWLGGQVALKLARTARWWAVKYVRLRELEAAGQHDRRPTVAEMLNCLPPFRIVDAPSRGRIWLEAYIVDTQASFMAGKPPMATADGPNRHCEHLRGAQPSVSSASPGASVRISVADRQLVGHALLMEIMIDAQNAERHSGMSSVHSNGEYSAHVSDEAVHRRLHEIQGSLEALDRWKLRNSREEDLSFANPVTLDFSFMYVLAKAYIGSLALNIPPPPVSMSSSAYDSRSDALHRLSSLRCQQITAAKDAALLALALALGKRNEGFADRLVAMPTWYHYLLCHATGFLIRIVQQRTRLLVAREAENLVEQIEKFVQMYSFAITQHAYQAPPHTRRRSNSSAQAHPQSHQYDSPAAHSHHSSISHGTPTATSPPSVAPSANAHSSMNISSLASPASTAGPYLQPASRYIRPYSGPEAMSSVRDSSMASPYDPVNDDNSRDSYHSSGGNSHGRMTAASPLNLVTPPPPAPTTPIGPGPAFPSHSNGSSSSSSSSYETHSTPRSHAQGAHPSASNTAASSVDMTSSSTTHHSHSHSHGHGQGHGQGHTSHPSTSSTTSSNSNSNNPNAEPTFQSDARWRAWTDVTSTEANAHPASGMAEALARALAALKVGK